MGAVAMRVRNAILLKGIPELTNLSPKEKRVLIRLITHVLVTVTLVIEIGLLWKATGGASLRLLFRLRINYPKFAQQSECCSTLFSKTTVLTPFKMYYLQGEYIAGPLHEDNKELRVQ